MAKMRGLLMAKLGRSWYDQTGNYKYGQTGEVALLSKKPASQAALRPFPMQLNQLVKSTHSERLP